MEFRPVCSCDLDYDLMTFIYELDSYSVKRYWRAKNEFPRSRLSNLIVLQTDRQTNRQSPKWYTTPLSGWSISLVCVMHVLLTGGRFPQTKLQAAAWHNCLSAISHYSDLSRAITWRVVYAACKRRPPAENTRVLQHCTHLRQTGYKKPDMCMYVYYQTCTDFCNLNAPLFLAFSEEYPEFSLLKLWSYCVQCPGHKCLRGTTVVCRWLAILVLSLQFVGAWHACITKQLPAAGVKWSANSGAALGVVRR